MLHHQHLALSLLPPFQTHFPAYFFPALFVPLILQSVPLDGLARATTASA